MKKADFYVGMGKESEWIGSVSKCGEIWALSTQILIQVNKTMYEELVVEYINFCEGIVANHVCQWPWPWADSRMTDYSYIFIPKYEKVFMSIEGGVLMDPIKIVQGKDVIEASTYLGPPIFPLMINEIPYNDKELYGQELTASI